MKARNELCCFGVPQSYTKSINGLKKNLTIIFNVQMQYVTGLSFSRKFDKMFYTYMVNFHIKMKG